ncbi:metal ABC transporter permease [Sulfurimonas sp.]|uniref:metal ABC transporter permease n=1 Tax=Sulfurimonas sp. TaxID=2022749 RepID=UPI0025E63D1D|nr:metal ABC transporter permease [Sulfurimonas sp.]
MLEAINYEFMQNALIAGVLVSFISGVIGSLIVVNRMVFLAGGIAHAAYGGIGIAIYGGFSIFLGTTVFAIIAALFMAFITIKQREKIDIFIGLIWAVGMAIGIILVDLTPGYNVDMMSYLFGSILAVNNEDLYYMGGLFILISFAVNFWYRDILAVSYDSEYASLCGINVKFFYTLILVLSALTVVIAIKVVGLILVIALLTIPIYIAQGISSSLYSMMLASGLIATFFTIIGLWISYSFNLTSGACIILVSAFSLIIFMIGAKLK